MNSPPRTSKVRPSVESYAADIDTPRTGAYEPLQTISRIDASKKNVRYVLETSRTTNEWSASSPSRNRPVPGEGLVHRPAGAPAEQEPVADLRGGPRGPWSAPRGGFRCAQSDPLPSTQHAWPLSQRFGPEGSDRLVSNGQPAPSSQGAASGWRRSRR